VKRIKVPPLRHPPLMNEVWRRGRHRCPPTDGGIESPSQNLLARYLKLRQPYGQILKEAMVKSLEKKRITKGLGW